MPRVQALLAIVPALVLAGCAGTGQAAPAVAGVAEGDAWDYTVTTDGVARTDQVRAVALRDLPWDGGSRPAMAVVTASGGHATELSVEFMPTAAASLGKTLLEPDRRTEELWESDCPLLPPTLRPGPHPAVRCWNRHQRLGADGQTQALILEGVSVAFDVAPPERLQTPAGAFDAVRIAVDYRSDAGDASIPRDPAVLWYAPDACAPVRVETGGAVRELAAFRCAASGRSHGHLPIVPGADDAVAAAVAAFGPDPAFATCLVPYTGLGAGSAEVDPLGLDCPLPAGLDGRGLGAADALRLQVTWEGRPLPQAAVHVSAAGMETTGTSSPLVLEVPASLVDGESFRASVHGDGPALFEEFVVEFRLLPEPAGPGRPF